MPAQRSCICLRVTTPIAFASYFCEWTPAFIIDFHPDASVSFDIILFGFYSQTFVLRLYHSWLRLRTWLRVRCDGLALRLHSYFRVVLCSASSLATNDCGASNSAHSDDSNGGTVNEGASQDCRTLMKCFAVAHPRRLRLCGSRGAFSSPSCSCSKDRCGGPLFDHLPFGMSKSRRPGKTALTSKATTFKLAILLSRRRRMPRTACDKVDCLDASARGM
mmetsp:Transcript_45218/g.98354  ORF Transcript_45218/g.98354 Transcript_45218/m.98354 type:complete len:219 (+) Transcript_45218:435-1091(+)